MNEWLPGVRARGYEVRRALGVARDDGVAAVGRRLLRRAANRAERGTLELGGVRAQDLTAPVIAERTRPLGTPPELALVITPPSQSGGHRTAMRVLQRFEEAGYRCRIYLYDVYGGSARDHEARLRSFFPRIRAEVRDAVDGLDDHDAVMATSWDTAHFVARQPATGTRFYLIQDYEPWFYPRGSQYAFAEQTYRLGLRGIAIGSWLGPYIAERFGVRCESFPYACDVSQYRVSNDGPRDGVVLYTRPTTDRRGYELGMLALQLVHQARPRVPLHTFGQSLGWKGFPIVDHGTLDPARINDLYNRCAVGVAFSMTDVSLTPWEMLAAGCLPVVNDSRYVRADLANPHVRWAEPTPAAVAEAILAALDARPDRRELSGGVATMSWYEASGHVLDVVGKELGV